MDDSAKLYDSASFSGFSTNSIGLSSSFRSITNISLGLVVLVVAATAIFGGTTPLAVSVAAAILVAVFLWLIPNYLDSLRLAATVTLWTVAAFYAFRFWAAKNGYYGLLGPFFPALKIPSRFTVIAYVPFAYTLFSIALAAVVRGKIVLSVLLAVIFVSFAEFILAFGWPLPGDLALQVKIDSQKSWF